MVIRQAGRHGEAVRNMHGGSREGTLGAVFLDNPDNLQHHVLFHFMVAYPFRGPGKAVNKKIQRRGGKLVEVHNKRLAGIDVPP